MIRFWYAPTETTADGLTKPVGELPPLMRVLHYDPSLDRAVVRTDPASTSIPAEWSEVDQALVDADYPGVIGG